MAPVISLQVQDHQLQVMVQRIPLTGAGATAQLGLAVRDSLEVIRKRAVRNVSGYPVSYDGGFFRIRVQTGALKGALEAEWPYGGVLQGRVFVNGAHTSVSSIGGFYSKPVPVSQYAAAIENGHGEIDLKKTMEGKTVPFFGARAKNAQGPYAATGLTRTPLTTYWREPLYSSTRLNRKLAQKGKRPMYFERRPTRGGGGSYFISYRKVGKEGWIIPAAKPRPFLDAALQNSRADVRRIVGSRVRSTLTAPIELMP